MKKVSVVNIDHPYAEAFLAKDIVTDNLYTVGFGPNATVRAENIVQKKDIVEFDVRIPSNVFRLRTHLYGKFNIANILTAAAVLMSQRVDIVKIQEIVEKFQSVPGRLEEIPNNRLAKIFIDYAHTEESLRSVIDTMKTIR